VTQSPGAASNRYAQRYGASRARLGRRTIVLIVAAVLALATAGVWVFAMGGNAETVTFKDVNYTTPDAWHATEDIEVSKEASTTAYCTVKAMDSSFGIVGWKQLEFGPTPGGSGMVDQTAHVALRTQSQAVSVAIDTCWIAGT
jgi:hypothetical protein